MPSVFSFVSMQGYVNILLRKIRFCLLAILLPYPAFAQLDASENEQADSFSNSHVIGSELHKGFVIIHSESIRNVEDSYPFGFDLNYNWHQNSKEAWRTCKCYPRTGFSFSYFNYDNPKLLGEGYSLSGFVEPYFSTGNRLNLSLKATCGLGYMTKPYDEQKNPDNLSYSLHVNGYLQLNLSLNYRLSKHWQLNLGANYNHVSNGGLEQPNKGINFPTASVGVDYILNPQTFPDRSGRSVNWDTTDKDRVDVRSFAITKNVDISEDKRYFIYGVSGRYSYKLDPLNALVGGGEYIVNNVVKADIQAKGESAGTFQYHRGSVLVGHEFLLGKFIFSEQIGIYLHAPYEPMDPVYQRYSLSYYLNEAFHVGIALKSHRHVADFLDVQVGYSF